MFEIRLEAIIPVPKALVWQVLLDTAAYPEWNPFVVACQSSFEVGAPIRMKVKLFSRFALRQKETICRNSQGEFLEYGIHLPFGLLTSSRQHSLDDIDQQSTRYQSVFVLTGCLSGMVALLLGRRLEQGFAAMTDGLVTEAKKRHQSELT